MRLTMLFKTSKAYSISTHIDYPKTEKHSMNSCLSCQKLFQYNPLYFKFDTNLMVTKTFIKLCEENITFMYINNRNHFDIN